jgi:GT2 family glycosyltransferase
MARNFCHHHIIFLLVASAYSHLPVKATASMSYDLPIIPSLFCSFTFRLLPDCEFKAVSQTGGFDPAFFLYLEDVDFSRRICELGLNILYCPYSFVYHESQRKSYKSFRFLIMHIQSAIKYFNKWGWICDKNRTMFNKKCIRALPDKKTVH